MSQCDPTPGRDPVTEPAIEAIVATIRSQSERGRRKYGTELMTFNGRDAGQDAWEELADLTVYLQQMRMEKHALLAEIERLKSLDEVRNCALYQVDAILHDGSTSDDEKWDAVTPIVRSTLLSSGDELSTTQAEVERLRDALTDIVYLYQTNLGYLETCTAMKEVAERALKGERDVNRSTARSGTGCDLPSL